MSFKKLCPFCNGDMYATSIKGVYRCPNDKFKVDLLSESGMFEVGAPSYLLESAKFLSLFRTLKPIYVFASEKLYTPFFRLKDCVFVGTKGTSEDVTCVKGHLLNFTKHVKGKHLIAANNFIADGLFDYVYNSVKIGCDQSPLSSDEIPTAFQQLFLKFILVNNYDNYADKEAFKATKAYLQPTLESMSESVWPGIFSKDSRCFVDDSMALYSYLMCEPHVNIRWGVGAEQLMSNIKSFIKACLNGIDSIAVEDNCDGMNNSISKYSSEDKLIEELFQTYIKSMPSTAINYNSVSNSTFCVLNHEFKNNPFEEITEDKMNNNNIVLLLNSIYSTHAYLFERYCYDITLNFGFNKKIEWLINNCNYKLKSSYTSSRVVVDFWDKFAKKLEELE